MYSKDEIKATAISTLKLEAEAINNLTNYVNDDFIETVEIINNSNGRVVITGIGKSANIAQKIVATLNSTGTPSVFMHAADAIHGDLGNIQQNDVVICISKSGNTPEIKVLVPIVKSFGNKLIAITGSVDSFLGIQADYTLNTYVVEEACPNNLAPTTSTTAQLAIGDALAVCLLKLNGFTRSDFAKYHPGGALGKKLYLRVADIYPNNEKPIVSANTPLKDVIIEISKGRLGICAVVKDDTLLGVITDGDIRRMLQQNIDINTTVSQDIMNKNPKTINSEELAINALSIMEQNNITQLIVIEKNNYMGVIHLHDLLKEGLL